MILAVTPANAKKLIITHRTFSWLDHAERHFKDGVAPWNDSIVINRAEEVLMYLCIMSHVGMFDCPKSE